MKAKLQIHGHSYALLLQEKLVAFAHPEDFSKDEHVIGVLSLENCEAIKLGYDLGEIIKDEVKAFIIGDPLTYMRGIWVGFQKALEILGDKKFTENNIDEAFDAGYEMLDSPKNYNDVLKEFKESLESTEWDVEIVCLHTGDNTEHTTNTGLPKLDTDGCLILKRL